MISPFFIFFFIFSFQEFACVSGAYPVDEECSEVAMQFWEYFLVCGSTLIVDIHVV